MTANPLYLGSLWQADLYALIYAGMTRDELGQAQQAVDRG